MSYPGLFPYPSNPQVKIEALEKLMLGTTPCDRWDRKLTVVVQELKKGLALQSTVTRDGEKEVIDSSELVPGDIVQLGEVIYNLVQLRIQR